MFIASKRHSLPSIETYFKTVAETEKDVNLAPEMNKLINEYFSNEEGSNLEEEMAGENSASDYLPLDTVENCLPKLKADVEHLSQQSLGDGSMMTSLDIIKIFFGIKTT